MPNALERLEHYRAMPLNAFLRYRDNWQRAVIAKVPMTAQQRRVFDVVVDNIGHTDSKGYTKGVCKLTNATIASYAGMEGKNLGERVRRHLQPLTRAGALLETQKAVGGNGRLKRARHLTMGDFASLSVAETEGDTPTKPKGDTPTKPKGDTPTEGANTPTNTRTNTPTKPKGNTPTNKQTPPRNCGDSLDQRSGRDKKTSSLTTSARAREAWEESCLGLAGEPVDVDGVLGAGRYSFDDLVRMRREHFTTAGEGPLWDVVAERGPLCDVNWGKQVYFIDVLNRFIASLPSGARSDDWAEDFGRWIDGEPGGLRRRAALAA